MARSQVTVIKDSLTLKPVKEEDVKAVHLVIGDDSYMLDLTEDSFSKLMTTLDPFVKNETKVTLSTPAPRTKSQTPNPTPEERSAIAKFVAEKGIGTVAKGGKVRGEFITAWKNAGSPM